MINLSNSQLYQLLPINLRDDEDITAAVQVVDQSTQSIYSLADKLAIHSSSGHQDEEVLDALAVDLHVDFYDKNLPPVLKQEIIDSSIFLHMIKGTAGAVEKALDNVGLEGLVSEWFEYGGNPFFFRIEITQPQPFKTEEDFKRIIGIVNSTKNRRSTLEKIIIKRSLESNLYFAGIISTRNKIQIRPAAFKMPSIQQTKYYAGFISMRSRTIIKSEV